VTQDPISVDGCRSSSGDSSGPGLSC